MPESDLPPTTSGDRRRFVVAIGGVLAALVVIMVVLAASASTAPSSGAGPVTFNGALGSATGVVAGVAGGPWHVSSAEGFLTTMPVTLNNSFLAEGCTVTSGTFQPTTYPASSGSYPGGRAQVWILTYVGSDPSSGVLFIQVVEGVASVIGQLAGSGPCALRYSPALGEIVDSSVALQAALATPNGTRFEQLFSHANATYTVGGNVPPTWVVSLNGCGRYLFGPGTLYSSVWAGNGTIQNPPRDVSGC